MIFTKKPKVSTMSRGYTGFTLAEVLITLGIIGIVAVLTIPIIQSVVWDTQQKSQFKKAYATVNNAMYQIKISTGTFPDCFYPTYDITGAVNPGCGNFFSEFRNNLNIIKSCFNHNGYAGGCVPNYTYSDSSMPCSGLQVNNVLNWNYAYVLADGIIIVDYYQDGNPILLVDINGQNGPNKLGYDLFDIVWWGNNDFIKVGMMNSSCMTPASGGRTTKNMLQYAFQ